MYTRRSFLRSIAAGASAFGMANGASERKEHGGGAQPAVTQLSPHLMVYHGPLNAGIIRNGRKCLLIDTGDERIARVLPTLGIDRVEQIVFTHHHRDQACGANVFSDGKTQIKVPAAEAAFFADVESYWNNPKHRWHIYNQHPHHLMLAESLRVDGTVSDGDTFTFGPAKITVIATPGHTDGHLSYLVDVDGIRACFSGDAIYDAGRIWELYSLQKGVQTTDYHGFLGARDTLVQSLKKICGHEPALLVPSHGTIMRDPGKAVGSLMKRLEICYDRYVAISALRYYFPKLFTMYKGKKDHMAIRPGRKVPDCLRHIGTSWIVVSETGNAFVMDCGTPQVVRTLKEWRKNGTIREVEGLWITHYHDDHVDAIPAFQEAFSCECIADRHVAEVVTQPRAWRIPCISPARADVTRVISGRTAWKWREFTLTAFHLPGQTLYHGGLLVEKDAVRMLFVGDSFTPAGIDDYCAHNRNWLGKGVGFDRCVSLIEETRPTHIFNCHVNEAFDFTGEQCRFMHETLAERERLYGELFPWDHANYGMDEPWIRVFPYESIMKPGTEHTLQVVVTNHSAVTQKGRVRYVLPRSWKTETRFGRWASFSIPPKQEGAAALSFRVPDAVPRTRSIITFDVCYSGVELPQFTEAVVHK